MRERNGVAPNDPSVRRTGQPPGNQYGYGPGAVQLRTTVNAQPFKRPVAPPVYRPQQTRPALQTKPAIQPRADSTQVSRAPVQPGGAPVAPPVYRPHPTLFVLQSKMSAGALSQARPMAQPAAPFPRPLSALQPAKLIRVSPPPARPAPVAPPVYRPQPVPRVLQTKAAAPQIRSAIAAPAPPKMNPVLPATAQASRLPNTPAAMHPQMARTHDTIQAARMANAGMTPTARVAAFARQAMVAVVQMTRTKNVRGVKKNRRVRKDTTGLKASNLKDKDRKFEAKMSKRETEKQGKPVRVKLVRRAPGNFAYSARSATVYGQSSKLTAGEIMSTSAGGQTTYLEAKINGHFVGKFSNADFHMGSSGWDLLSGNRRNYPAAKVVTAPWNDPSKTVDDVCKAHAEDYLLVALNVIHGATGGDWSSKYSRAEAQTSDLLSIRISKSPCLSCAQNLISACQAFGLNLRIKAALGHMNEDATLSGGVAALDAANVPIRFWTVNQFTQSRSNAKLHEDVDVLKARNTPPYKHTTRSEKETVHKGLFDAARPTHRGADVGWGAYGFSRKGGTSANLAVPDM
jgi:hypothetical protein